jgi:hypothetical protein
VPGKRKYERDSVSLIICYSLCGQNSDKSCTAMMENYSYSGLCMVTPHALEEDQEILIRSGLSEESLRAVVRWTKSNGGTSYKVGLEFRR